MNDTKICLSDKKFDHEFCIRYVNWVIMDLYGYFLEHSLDYKKVNVGGHDEVHFMTYDSYGYGDLRNYKVNYSILWFSSGRSFII